MAKKHSKKLNKQVANKIIPVATTAVCFERPLSTTPVHQPQPIEAGQDVAQAAQDSWQSILGHRDQVASGVLRDKRPFIQAKLTLGPAGDKYEQEADSIAKQVIGNLNSSQPQVVQRQEEEEMMAKPIQRQEEEEMQLKPISAIQRQEEEELMAKVGGDALAGGPVPADIESEIQSARGGGQPMADGVRGLMEQAFGADFGGVRVHTGSQSDGLNQSIQARAFTTGQDIFFRSGEYSPGSASGQELLAHELTHVVQQTADVKAENGIQRALGVNSQVVANDVQNVKELKQNTIFKLSGNQGDSLIVKIEILPSGHGNRERWTEYKGRYEASQELAMGVLDDTDVPNKSVLGDNEVNELLIVTQTDSPIQIVGGGFGSRSQQLRQDSEERKAQDNHGRQQLAQAIGWHQGADGLMVKMEDVGGVVDVAKEIREREQGGEVKTGDEGEQLKALFTPENVKKLGSVAYYDILTRNWDRFQLENGPVNNINMREATNGVMGLDNINSAPGSHLSERGDQWVGELAEMERFRERQNVIDYGYLSLDKFAQDYGGALVEEWNVDEITKANLALQFAAGFEEAKGKASNVAMGWQLAIRNWKRGQRGDASENAVMKAKEVIFTRQAVADGLDFGFAQRMLD